MAIITDSRTLTKRFVGSMPITRVYIGTREVFRQGTPPVITALSAAPNNIDLDTRASGTVTITFGVTGSTHNRLYNTRTGANIPFTTSTTAIFNQPNQTTTYRLVSQNATGATHRDVTINVSKNPTIANFRRTGFAQNPSGGSVTYQFEATVGGLPRPVLTYRFTTGEQGTVNVRHFVQGATPDVWTVRWTVVLANANARGLTVTATNASGSVTATLANINT